MFKVGQRAWFCLNGWGQVTQILDSSKPYPVEFVPDTGGKYLFTHEGKWCTSDQRPLLFHDEPKDWPNPPPPLPEIAVDTPVWVWNTGGSPQPVHFASWGEDEAIYTWAHGRTSHTETVYVIWYNWSLTKPE